ncbi:MAG: CBO0543 family protein [Bacillota bacterium]
MSTEQAIAIISAGITLLLLIFAVDWRYFRDWIVVFLFKGLLDIIWGGAVAQLKMITYPVRLFAQVYDSSLLFEVWVFPVLCILYNQITREKGLWAILGYAVLFGGGITALEYPLEKYTALITYVKWTWVTSFYTLTFTFLFSRVFIAFYRWGCRYFGGRETEVR